MLYAIFLVPAHGNFYKASDLLDFGRRWREEGEMMENHEGQIVVI